MPLVVSYKLSQSLSRENPIQTLRKRPLFLLAQLIGEMAYFNRNIAMSVPALSKERDGEV